MAEALNSSSAKAQTQFASSGSSEEGISLAGLDSPLSQAQGCWAPERIFPKLARNPVWDVRALHREWGQKANPKIPVRPG